MSGDETLLEVLVDRLDRSSLSDAEQLLVLAAFQGDEQLEHAVDGAVDLTRTGDGRGAAKSETAPAFLRKVTVQGFRGIGAEASLMLQPGPGLTLVVGRNGSSPYSAM